jgi:hypothetical protein
MSAISIQQMADRIAALMEEKLGARGGGLRAKLAARGGRLPRKVRAAAEALARDAELAQNPKLLLQIDHAALARNYDTALHHLTRLKARSGWLDGTVAVAASVAMSILLVVLLVAALMRWRGLI